ncbi:MAG: hypothetical protein FWG89_06495 [Treponema sp.]|nr:hypothetical protein [Treponema sp.]
MYNSALKILKPWMIKPFELIYHAETHYRKGSDYSKRMAYINFDNAIEVSIYSFMYINTIPKGEKIYRKEELEKVKNSYFDKLKVLEGYIKKEHLPIKWEKDVINHYHDQRNKLYHDASLSSPDTSELNTIRQIAFWIFTTLFKIANIEDLLDASISESENEFPHIPEEYVKPIISDIKQKHETPLFIASIIGRWNENSQGDNEIINEVTNGF